MGRVDFDVQMRLSLAKAVVQLRHPERLDQRVHERLCPL